MAEPGGLDRDALRALADKATEHAEAHGRWEASSMLFPAADVLVLADAARALLDLVGQAPAGASEAGWWCLGCGGPRERARPLYACWCGSLVTTSERPVMRTREPGWP